MPAILHRQATLRLPLVLAPTATIHRGPRPAYMVSEITRRFNKSHGKVARDISPHFWRDSFRCHGWSRQALGRTVSSRTSHLGQICVRRARGPDNDDTPGVAKTAPLRAPLVAAPLPLGTALFFALYQALTRLVSRRDEPIVTLAWTISIGLLITTPALAFLWQQPASGEDWALMGLSGVLFGLG